MIQRRARAGVTLFELLLVMAILVTVSALAVPSLNAMYGSYKVNGAVDSVRAAWADARARAIEEGRPYRFAVEPSGSSYRVAPDQADYWEGNEGPSDDPSGRGLIVEHSLPSGVRFTLNGEATNLPDEPASDSIAEKPVTTNNWESAVVFLPDGTAREDVRITFRVRGAKTTSIQLRGLTGNVSVHTD